MVSRVGSSACCLSLAWSLGAAAPALAAEPASPQPKRVELHLDAGGRPRACSASERFTPLSVVLAQRPAGRVRVRGRLWTPASYPCTASEPPHCTAYLVLAPSRPGERPARHLVLVGELAPDRTFACDGRPPKLSCPVPADGEEYGVVGELEPAAAEDEAQTLRVERLCRIRPRR